MSCVSAGSPVLLFDIDGVLVRPAAYRRAVGETIALLCRDAGLPDCEQLLPSEDDIAAAEACGIHDVWDITCICYAALLAGALRSGALSLTADPTSAVRLCALHARIAPGRAAQQRPQYAELMRALGAGAMRNPAAAARALLLRNGGGGAFADLIAAVLHETRDPRVNEITALFQNIVLGDVLYQDCYRSRAALPCRPLLTSADTALISSANAAWLCERAAQKVLACAVYTARPGNAPLADAGAGYSPEAELAQALAGLGSLPVVSMGTVAWLALQNAVPALELTKPYHAHAACALAAALAGRVDPDILQEAYLFSKGEADLDRLPAELELVVFEDAPSGIIPLRAVAQRAAAGGRRVALTSYGIADNEEKRAALREAGALVFADVNQALDHWRTRAGLE